MGESVSRYHVDLQFLTETLIPCPEKYIRKLTGNTDIEDSLERLDKLTQEEARMASAELLKMTHIVDGKVQDVGNEVRAVDDRVQGIGNDVKETGSDIKDLRSDVKDISSEVRGFDDKLDQVNRS